jgi:hypothetical protein
MRTRTVRWFAVGGWSAASAVVAHGGAGILAESRWLAVALAGSLAAAASLSVLLAQAFERYALASRIQQGDYRVAGCDAFSGSPLSATAASMLLCQGAAHLALLMAGVHATAGAPGAAALHVVLALLGAALLHELERVLGRSTAVLRAALRAALALLSPAIPAFRRCRSVGIDPAVYTSQTGPRAPPVFA